MKMITRVNSVAISRAWAMRWHYSDNLTFIKEAFSQSWSLESGIAYMGSGDKIASDCWSRDRSWFLGH